jgi:hypothetical protein
MNTDKKDLDLCIGFFIKEGGSPVLTPAHDADAKVCDPARQKNLSGFFQVNFTSIPSSHGKKIVRKS